MTTKQEKLVQLREQLQALEEEMVDERKGRLRTLHEEVNLPSTAALILELQALKSRRGSRLSPETRKAIEKDLKAGKKGAAVMREHGVSSMTIQNIKNDLGLVKKRKKKATKKKAK